MYYSYRVSLTDVIWFQEINTPLVHCHLTKLAAVTLSSKAPDPVLTLVTVSHLESLGYKLVAIDPAHLLPSSCTPTMVETRYGMIETLKHQTAS